MQDKGQTGPSTADTKRLFALSGNRCAFPRCRNPIIIDGTVVGEICHIHAASERGPRYLATQTAGQRHGFDNLILLCSLHHTVVDDDWETYTPDRLRKMKADHEDHSTPLPDGEAERGAGLLALYSIRTSNQTGGIAAGVVNARDIHLHAAKRSEEQERRRAQAISAFWGVIVKLKEDFSSITFVDSILTKSELEACFNGADHNVFFEMLHPFASQNAIMDRMAAAGGKAAEIERPFVSNRLYLLYTAFQGVVGRSALLIQLSFKDESFRDWREDRGITQLLEQVLPKATIEHLGSLKVYGLMSVVDLLQSEFLKEAQSS